MDYEPIPLPHYVEIPVEDMRRRAQDFHAGISTRHTVREFSPRPLPRDIIEQCLLAAGTAPSGANHQPWHFCVISDPALKRLVREGAEAEERAFYAGRAGQEWLEALRPLGTDANKAFLETAPYLIAIFGARKSRGADGKLRKNYYVPESVGIATGFLIAALHRAGLVTLTHTPAPMGFLNDICGRSENDKPYILLVTGYPASGATIPAYALHKKPLGEIATFL
jgi:nitroreductase